MLSGNKPLVCSRVGSVVTAGAGFQYRLVRAFWVCVCGDGWFNLSALIGQCPTGAASPSPSLISLTGARGGCFNHPPHTLHNVFLTGWETHQNGKMVCVGLNAENSSTEFWQEGVLFDQNKYKNRYWRTKKRKIKTLWTWRIEVQHKSGLFGS